jgi:hypothetical protein
MWCPGCRRDKLPEEFVRSRASKTGYHTYCKPCHNTRTKRDKQRLYGGQRNFLLKLRYGVTEEEITALAAAQGSTCAVCRIRPPHHVDHDHTTRTVRGILCFNCNGALGRFGDDPLVLDRAIEYLVAHGHR